jgi:hypothetical protein
MWGGYGGVRSRTGDDDASGSGPPFDPLALVPGKNGAGVSHQWVTRLVRRSLVVTFGPLIFHF